MASWVSLILNDNLIDGCALGTDLAGNKFEVAESYVTGFAGFEPSSSKFAEPKKKVKFVHIQVEIWLCNSRVHQ